MALELLLAVLRNVLVSPKHILSCMYIFNKKLTELAVYSTANFPRINGWS